MIFWIFWFFDFLHFLIFWIWEFWKTKSSDFVLGQLQGMKVPKPTLLPASIHIQQPINPWRNELETGKEPVTPWMWLTVFDVLAHRASQVWLFPPFPCWDPYRPRWPAPWIFMRWLLRHHLRSKRNILLSDGNQFLKHLSNPNIKHIGISNPQFWMCLILSIRRGSRSQCANYFAQRQM